MSNLFWVESDDASEEKVFHDRELVHDLSLVHLHQSPGDFFPGSDSADIIEHGRVFSEMSTALNEPYVLDAVEVHIVLGLCIEYLLVMNAAGWVPFLSAQFRGAEEEGQEVVVVQSPDPMRARGFQLVGGLYLAHDGEVLPEDVVHDAAVVRGCEVANAEEAQQEGDEVEFVACAVVDADGVAEAVAEVGGQFLVRVLDQQGLALRLRAQELGDQGEALRVDAVLQGGEGLVAVSLRLRYGRRLVHPDTDTLQEAHHRIRVRARGR